MLNKNLLKNIGFILALLGVFTMSGISENIQIGAFAVADTDDPVINLMNSLDLTNTEVKEVAIYIKQGKYDEAMRKYSAYLIYKIRNLDLGEFLWHNTLVSQIKMDDADIITGKISEEEYRIRNKNNPLKDEFYNLFGKPDSIPEKWIDLNDNGGVYANFYNFIPLASAYWNTTDEVYLKKWFQITSGFCLNQKKQIEALSSTPAFNSHLANWTNSAQVSLSQANRTTNIIKSLAVFAKCLPAGGNNVQWSDVLKPRNEEVPAEVLSLIPEKQLAAIVLSLINDHPTALIERYINAGAAPNQRFSGLVSLALISRIFSEFKEVRHIDQQANTGIIDYVKGMYYPDGAILEQSFNYNMASNSESKQLLSLYNGYKNIPAWAEDLKAKVDYTDRMFTALASPVGGLPGLGSYMPPNAPALWQSQEIQDNWKISAKIDDSKKAYTSIAFPYAGYYILRNGWDMMDDLYMSFVGSSRSRGHSSPNTNAIEVVAYGRKFLTYGGIPWYDTSMAPDNQKSEYEKINSYFAEDSSYKNNTVIVNGKSQSKTNKDGNILQDARVETYPARWLTTENYDFVEGIWDGGYKQASDIKIMRISHSRQVIFIKDAGLWVINDIMKNTNAYGKYEYSQMWGFTPKNEAKKAEGFSSDQVVIDDGSNYIMTQDKNGPNLWLYNFSSNNLTYEKYYGGRDSEQYLGWYSLGASGEKFPKVDIHVKWFGEKPVITAVVPSKNSRSLVTSKTDLSQDNVSGFEITTTGGNIITYLASASDNVFGIGMLSVEGRSILINKTSNGKVSGIVLGCISIKSNGKRILTKHKDFQFELEGNRLKNVVPVTVPTRFEWKETALGAVPEYSGISLDELASAECNLNEPVNGITNVDPKNIHFTWQKSEEATYYKLLIADDKNFKNIVSAVETSLTHIIISDLEPGQKYFWKVQAYNNRGLLRNNEKHSSSFSTEGYVKQNNKNIGTLIISIISTILISSFAIVLNKRKH